MNKISTMNTGPFGVNTYIVQLYENFVFVADSAACALTGDENAVVSFLKESGLEPVLFLQTHGHFDHIMGSAVLKRNWPLVPLCIHKEDAPFAGSNAASFQKDNLENMGLESLSKGLENLPDADVLLKGGETLLVVFNAFGSTSKNPLFKSLSKEKREGLFESLSLWKVLWTPGHSPGCVCFYNEKEKILLSGDTVFFRSWGRTDLTGGSEEKIMKSLVFLKKTVSKDTIVYPGHDYNGFPFEEGL